MKNYFRFIVVLLLFQGQHLLAQTKIHLTAGADYNLVKVSNYKTFESRSPYRPGLGYSVGINGLFYSNKKVSLLGELAYQALPYQTKYSDYSTKQNYISVMAAPVLHFHKGMSIMAGANFGVLIKESIELTNQTNLMAVAGISKSFGKLGVDFRLAHSITPFYEESINTFTKSFYHRLIHMGITYKIHTL